VQPKNVVDLVSNQLAAQVAQDSSTTALLAPFRQFPSNIPASEQTRLKNSATSAYEKEFIPAWKNLHDYIAGPYAAKARPQAGLGTSRPEANCQATSMITPGVTSSNVRPNDISARRSDLVPAAWVVNCSVMPPASR